MTGSESQQNFIATIPREQHRAIYQIINKVRMLNGWATKTAQELDARIHVWAEILNDYNIPYEYYDELYKLAFDVRQTKTQEGSKVPFFGAELLVSCWTGYKHKITLNRQ